TVAATPDYTLSASPSSVTVAQGTSGTSTITVSPQNGDPDSVEQGTSSLPSGVTVSFNPNPTTTTSTRTPAASSTAATGPVTASFSPNPTTTASTLTLAASSTAATGTVTVTITGNASGLTRATAITLTVAAAPAYTLSASPSSVTVPQGTSRTSTITVSPQN